MRRPPRPLGEPARTAPDPRRPRDGSEAPGLPLRATMLVLSFWISVLLILSFVVVPLLFATCGQATGTP